jgi:hypothetical protein
MRQLSGIGYRLAAFHCNAYADALGQYHISPESKFLNGDYLDRGTTMRRHIQLSGVCHIGKESNDWERQAAIGLNKDSQISYGVSIDGLAQQLQALITIYGEAQAATALAIPKAKLAKLMSGAGSRTLLKEVTGKIPDAIQLCKIRQIEMSQLRATIAKDGLRETARRLGIDASNLRRRLNRQSIGQPIFAEIEYPPSVP